MVHWARRMKLSGIAFLGLSATAEAASEWNGTSGDWYQGSLWEGGNVPDGNGTTVLLDGSLLTSAGTVNYQPLWNDASQFDPLYQHVTLLGASPENSLTFIQTADPWGGNNNGAGPTSLRSSQVHIGLYSLYDLQGGSLAADLSVVGTLQIKPSATVTGRVTLTGTGQVLQSGGAATYDQFLINGLSDTPRYQLTAGSVETEQFNLYTGRFKQSGGTMEITGETFVLGFSFSPTSESAIIELSGTGQFTSAALVQVGGANVDASILQSGGSLTANAGIAIASNGTFIQSAGTVSSDSLAVSGLLAISGGSFTTDEEANVYGNGTQTGVLSQTSGTITIGTDLTISGRVALAGGILNVTGTTRVDAPSAEGYGGFHHSAGSHVLGGDLEVARGTYALSGATSTLSMFGSLLVEGTSANPLFEMTDGSVTVGQHVLIGATEGTQGRWVASGGSLDVLATTGTVKVGAGVGDGGVGALTFDGDNTWTVSEVVIGSQRGLGTFTVTGGTSVIDGDLYLARVDNSLEDFPEGYLTVTGGSLEVNNLRVGSTLTGLASVSHSGGSLLVNDTLTLAKTYSLSGTGSLATGDTSILTGATFTQNTDSLAYKHSTDNLTIQSGAEYRLLGGELLVDETTSLTGTFTQSGGRHTTTDLILQGGSDYTLNDGVVVVLDEWRRDGSGTISYTQHDGSFSALSATFDGDGTSDIHLDGGSMVIAGALVLGAGATMVVDDATLSATTLTVVHEADFDATDEAILVGSLAGSGVKIAESISINSAEVGGGTLGIGNGGDVYLGLGATMTIAGRTTLSGTGILGIHQNATFQTGQMTFSPIHLDWTAGWLELTNSSLRVATASGGTEETFWGSSLALSSSQGLKVSDAVNVYTNSSLSLSAGVLEAGSVNVASGGSFTLSGSGLLRAGSFSFTHASGRTFELSGGSLQTTGDLLYTGGSGMIGTVSGGTHVIGGNFVIDHPYSDFRQSGGSVTVNGELRIGAGVGDDSTSYRLAAGSTLSSATTILGYNASSSFFLTGGTHSGGTLKIGNGSVGSGAYAITVAGGMVDFTSIELWNGSFSQSAGSVEADTLSVGTATGITARTGTYRLRGGTLTLGGLNIAGGSVATGVFEQSAGSLIVSGNIDIQKSSGSFLLSNGTVEASAIINRGTITFDPGSGGTTRSVDAPITNHHELIAAADTALLGSGLVLKNEATGTVALRDEATLSMASGATLENLGLITGSGTLGGVGATLTNSGTIAPGESPGTLIFTGDFTQTSEGTLSLEIGGLIAGLEYDQFLLTDGAHLFQGTLTIGFINGFLAEAGQTFELIGSTNATYAFDSIILTGLAPGLQGTTFDMGDFYRLEISSIPEPSAALLLLLGFITLFLTHRPVRRTPSAV